MELLNFKEYLKEDKDELGHGSEKHHVIAFGRMNPPTAGHMQVINKVHDVADKQKAGHTVVTSHSQDKKKNPLTASQKIKHLKRYSPKTNFKSSSSEHPTLLHHLAAMHKNGVTHAHIVVGSDRVKDMKSLATKYNGQKSSHGHYNFKKITVHSAGHRDPDAEGTAGVSGTKQREHAQSGNFKEFRKGVPEHVSDKHAKELMHDVNKGSK